MLLYIFSNNILPAFIIIGLGVLLERNLRLDIRTPTRMALYVLTPSLVFSSLLQSDVKGEEVTAILIFLFLVTLSLGLVSWFTSRLLKLDQVKENALMLATMFCNAGNFGLPVLLFTYGQEGMDRGIIFFVGSALFTHTLAAYFASRGKSSVSQSVKNVLRLPAVYAISLAFLFRGVNVVPPDFVLKSLTWVGSAAVPILLLVLGMQLSRTRIHGNLWLIGGATFIKLVVAAALAFLLAGVMGLQGLTRQVCIFEASTPTAVTVIMMSIEFDADPDFVTSVVFLSTLASSVTLTLILSLLA